MERSPSEGPNVPRQDDAHLAHRILNNQQELSRTDFSRSAYAGFGPLECSPQSDTGSLVGEVSPVSSTKSYPFSPEDVGLARWDTPPVSDKRHTVSHGGHAVPLDLAKQTSARSATAEPVEGPLSRIPWTVGSTRYGWDDWRHYASSHPKHTPTDQAAVACGLAREPRSALEVLDHLTEVPHLDQRRRTNPSRARTPSAYVRTPSRNPELWPGLTTRVVSVKQVPSLNGHNTFEMTIENDTGTAYNKMPWNGSIPEGLSERDRAELEIEAKQLLAREAIYKQVAIERRERPAPREASYDGRGPQGGYF